MASSIVKEEEVAAELEPMQAAYIFSLILKKSYGALYEEKKKKPLKPKIWFRETYVAERKGER